MWTTWINFIDGIKIIVKCYKIYNFTTDLRVFMKNLLCLADFNYVVYETTHMLDARGVTLMKIKHYKRGWLCDFHDAIYASFELSSAAFIVALIRAINFSEFIITSMIIISDIYIFHIWC